MRNFDTIARSYRLMRISFPLHARLAALAFAIGAIGLAQPAQAATTCARQSFEGLSYIACTVDLATHDLVLGMGDGDGGPGTLPGLVRRLGPERVAFAMNAGMWRTRPSFGPAGLFVAGGEETAPLVTTDGPGNFHLKPNGVFLVQDGRPMVVTTEAYEAGDFAPEIATQSGPMLTIGGKIHPRIILPGGDSLNIRNAVGVTAGAAPIFVISENRVSFGWLARLFRDELDCPDALYFDGSVSRIHAPSLGVSGGFRAFGPMIAAVRR